MQVRRRKAVAPLAMATHGGREQNVCRPMVSTDQQATGFNAGARTASPVRRLKQA